MTSSHKPDVRPSTFVHQHSATLRQHSGTKTSTVPIHPAAYPNDPADRMIGATALAEALPLVTADRDIRRSRALHTVW